MSGICLHEEGLLVSPADMIVVGLGMRDVIHELSVETAALLDRDSTKTVRVVQVFCKQSVTRRGKGVEPLVSTCPEKWTVDQLTSLHRF